MPLKKYEFTIRTNRNSSEYAEEAEVFIPENATEAEKDDIVNPIYTEWVLENNTGTYTEIQ